VLGTRRLAPGSSYPAAELPDRLTSGHFVAADSKTSPKNPIMLMCIVIHLEYLQARLDNW